ncbi:MAG TPA: hypothetical protein EYQ61_02410 [Dehalococcoidia bacterium]|jgi:hypothetical protein|nr:hypothetical protein [Dehalococcoidia bacterium]
MPKNTRKSGTRKNRRTSTSNVFVQSETPQDDDSDIEQDAETSTAVSSAPRVRARVQRTTTRASARSEIYTRSLTGEIKKMGILSGAIAVVLVVLTFAL